MINIYPFWSDSRLPDEHESELGWFHEDVWNKVWFHQSQISEANYKTIGGHGTNAKNHFIFLRGMQPASALHDPAHKKES